MKQRITVKELSKLSNTHKELLHKWWKPQKTDLYTWHYTDGNGSDQAEYVVNDAHHGVYDDPEAHLIAVPILSIGQMIEYLENPTMEYDGDWVVTDGHRGNTAFDKELCDALFKLLKQILELE